MRSKIEKRLRYNGTQKNILFEKDFFSFFLLSFLTDHTCSTVNTHIFSFSFKTNRIQSFERKTDSLEEQSKNKQGHLQTSKSLFQRDDV